uniref:X-box-binding protein 1 n=1 Tax=Phallusia mammillata TaxID=59560 RepID=A0A6F9DXP4_9ASCI|nr:xBPc X box binding protein [Phallusia mammillata]
MPFTPNNSVMPVLPKPDHAAGGIVDSNTPLSAVEDKELRKKLRNRQSALAARERKKARMLELERQVAELQEMNRRTEDENQYLRARLEVMARKCVRAGMRLEGEKDFIRSYNFAEQQAPQQQALRVAGIPDYSNAYRPNQHGAQQYPVQQECAPTAYPMEKPYHHQSEGNIHQAVAAEGANGVSPTEANLRNAIKVLGARQHEILQSMSYNGMQSRQVGSPAIEPNLHAVKQEYVEQQPSPHCHNVAQNYSLCNQTSENAAIGMERSLEAPGRIPQRGAPHKRSMTDLRRQALPSIGAMLGSPAKRQCTQASFTHQHEAEEASPNPVRPVSTESHTNKPENQLPAAGYDFDLCQSQQPVSLNLAPELQASKVDLRDCNLNSASSPMMLNTGDCLSDEFYGAADDKLPILDFQDFIGGDLSADSPSGLSGSDSGVSMDDSLDWITENPIFDL